MDRLTRRLSAKSPTPNAADCFDCSGEYITRHGCGKRCVLRKQQLALLADYEDTGLTPAEIVKMNDFINSQLALQMKEIASLQSKLSQAERERDALLEDLKRVCITEETCVPCERFVDCFGDGDAHGKWCGGSKWQWRGTQETEGAE